MCQAAIARIDFAPFGPSKIPQPWMQAYSVPERLHAAEMDLAPLRVEELVPGHVEASLRRRCSHGAARRQRGDAGGREREGRSAQEDPFPHVPQNRRE